MPATEATWRNTSLLHQIFAVSGVLLTTSTVWMLWKDHARSWKNYQVQTNNIDLRMNELRQVQYETGDALVAHERAAATLAAAKAQPLNPQGLARFKSLANTLNDEISKWQGAGYAYSTVSVDHASIDEAARKLEELGAKAKQRRAEASAESKAADAAATGGQSDDKRREAEAKARASDQTALEAEQEAGKVYDELIAELRSIVDQGKAREDKALGFRKFKAADIDAAKAQLDIAIRDNLDKQEIDRRQKIVNELIHGEGEDDADSFVRLNAVYQSISGVRKDLDRILKQLTAAVDAAQKEFEESGAELERLREQHEEREESYFTLKWEYPWIFGKKILTLPILDAFSSPRKIDNLWSEGLTQDYNFSRVRRFDRCTTCHQSLAKTIQGQPTTPAYVREEPLELVVYPPPADAQPKPRLDADGRPVPLTLEDWLGLRLAREGLLVSDDVTVALVVPKSPAAKAVITSNLPPDTTASGLELRKQAAQLVSSPGEGEDLYPKLPGLLVGDVIEGINGQPFRTTGGDRGPRAIGARLMALAQEGRQIRLTVKRGLPNPYISHPRLDLYVADASPHRLQMFACTICHEGQGSATDFKWASHSPSTTLDMQRWIDDHGWFDNPHWIYPMYAKRFAEAACLKCHHDVVELEASEKYPEAPAPKVTHGYHLIRKYGCYGCHEINGFDGPSRRIGPDLRSEPNYFAVAQQIQAELSAQQQSESGRDSSPASAGAALAEATTTSDAQDWKSSAASLAAWVATHPEDGPVRNELRTMIEERVTAAGAETSPLDKSLTALASMLKDVEVPGTLRRPGPSLRYVNSKLDTVFLYDWIDNPERFRPDTRMPRFFGLWDHLRGAHGEMTDASAPKLEPIEIRGLITYLQSFATVQQFEPEQRPAGIHSWTDEEKIARGKTQFQTRGCLACHNHKDFPEVSAYRDPNEIVQGPDLSGVGSKFSPDRNPAGPDWLYSWIKNPSKYHVRTLMPNVFLDPDKDLGANVNDPQDDKWFDPADDIVAYLLSSSRSDWRPIDQALSAARPIDAATRSALEELTLEYLNEAFYRDAAMSYLDNGIPPYLEGELKGAEKDLVVDPARRPSRDEWDIQRLKYIGRKTIAKYGCFGCHDIPGFEDAKPIGTGLADWGRKDPARLAFEHITHYALGHGHAAPALAGSESPGTPLIPHEGPTTRSQAPPAEERVEPGQVAIDPDQHDGDHETRDFYEHALEAGNRIGFIYQKLKEPRSYDFDKTGNKRYNERLRMPQFPFSAEEREAIITFVIGLVADPPQPKFVFQAKDRQAALSAGRQVLEKYNCGGCHILGMEKWQVSYSPGDFGQRAEPPVYPFLKAHVGPQELAKAAKPDHRNELHSLLSGIVPADKADGYPVVLDPDGITLDSGSPYSRRELQYAIDLMQPSIVDGSPYYTGQAPVTVPAARLDRRIPTWGGVLTKYLLPEVTRLERQSNPNASGAEAYGWLPPPLVGEGNKVQTAWLHDFLLDPYPIRPAVFLRMPKFNMSSAEATALANYFAAADEAEFPYVYSSGRDRTRLAALEADYVQRPAPPTGAPAPAGGTAQTTTGSAPGSAASSEAPPGMQRLDDAMKIVVNGNFCVKCHSVADFEPAGSNRAKAPNLAEVYRRLRPEFVRNWIANPKMILPYTSMPVNIPYQDPPPILGQLYHGTNVEQIEAVTDLLMNYDQYARQSTRIADRVVPAPAEATPPAATESTGGGSN